MGKLKKVASALGSLGDVSNAREKFDNSARVFPHSAVFPPEDIRPAATDARTLLMRITTAEAPDSAQSVASAQGDTFAVTHIPAGKDFAVVLVLNPSTQIESGQTFADLVDEGRWPVAVALAEDVLGLHIDHVLELAGDSLSAVIAEVGPLQVYSRTAFFAEQVDFAEGTNHIDGESTAAFLGADPVDDAGQTRTRNQRALLRALIRSLKTGGVAKDPKQAATVLNLFADGSHHDATLSARVLSEIGNGLRQIPSDDIATVTVPTLSHRSDDGTVTVTFDPEALPALREALAGNDLPEFFRYLVSLGY